MPIARNKRFSTGLVLLTLALSAFFLSDASMAFVAAKVLDGQPAPAGKRGQRPLASKGQSTRHDASLVLRRNIFNSALGDLTLVPLDENSSAGEDVALEGDETLPACSDGMRLIGTAVIPDDLERSMAMILGSDKKAVLHQGSAEIEGSKVRAIRSNSVVLQTSGRLCELTMFDTEGAGKGAALAKVEPKPKRKPQKKKPKMPQADRNAGLSPEELDEGIEIVGPTLVHISREVLNKVLDNSGKLIGIAAVAPKMENNKSVGMEIRGIRPGTLLTKIGILNNDVLESINGQPLIGPDAALGAYTTLRTADKFSLAVKRSGRTMTINYVID